MSVEFKENRSSSYAFTVTDRNDPMVQLLRSVTIENNTMLDNFERPKYVKLQARGPRKHNGRKYYQSLPLEFGTHFDVYVYER